MSVPDGLTARLTEIAEHELQGYTGARTLPASKGRAAAGARAVIKALLADPAVAAALASPPAAEGPDDLAEFVAEARQDPVFAGAHDDAGLRAALLRAMVEHRRRGRLSQVAVAEAMGTTQSAVSDLEGGATDPRLSTLQRYARAVGAQLIVNLAAASPPAVPTGEPGGSGTGLDDLHAAVARTREALNEFVEGDSRVEGALTSNDKARRSAALARLEEASAEYSLALRDEVRARKQAAPSFAQLLQDPYVQFPGAEMVLVSILQHAAAAPVSAGAPLPVVSPAPSPSGEPEPAQCSYVYGGADGQCDEDGAVVVDGMWWCERHGRWPSPSGETAERAKARGRLQWRLDAFDRRKSEAASFGAHSAGLVTSYIGVDPEDLRALLSSPAQTPEPDAVKVATTAILRAVLGDTDGGLVTEGELPAAEVARLIHENAGPAVVAALSRLAASPAQAVDERAKEVVSDLAYLLYRLWRTNCDSERAEMGPAVAAAVEAYMRHPSKITWSPVPSPEGEPG